MFRERERERERGERERERGGETCVIAWSKYASVFTLLVNILATRITPSVTRKQANAYTRAFVYNAMNQCNTIEDEERDTRVTTCTQVQE